MENTAALAELTHTLSPSLAPEEPLSLTAEEWKSWKLEKLEIKKRPEAETATKKILGLVEGFNAGKERDANDAAADRKHCEITCADRTSWALLLLLVYKALILLFYFWHQDKESFLLR